MLASRRRSMSTERRVGGRDHLLVLLVVFAVCGCFAAGYTPLATPLATHVLNVTLNAAGWPTTATELEAQASSLRTAVNTTVCGSLPSTVSRCDAFMSVVSSTTSPVQVAVQASVQTASYGDGNSTYTLLSQWAAGTGLFSLTALGGTLPAPTYSAGVYTVPCRGAETYAYLPACSATEAPSTTVYVRSSTTALQPTFLGYLCPAGTTTTCGATVMVASLASDYQQVTITGTSKGLEAVLSFVADVRASVLGTSSAINGERVGSATAQLSVTAVELPYRSTRAVLFSATENERRYLADANLSLQCESSYSMWAIALVVVPFLAIGLFRYIYYRGRRRAKKHERRRIVEDETRIMQGYTSPAGAQAAAAAPPPGVDASSAALANAAPEWVMDENGTYYDANAAAANNAPRPGTDAVTYQTWVDPETGDTYQYAVDSTGAPIDTGNGETASQQAGSAEYQTYVDPTTGESYQNQDPGSTAQGAGADGGAAQAAPEAGSGGASYQTYVDPETGETYQYTLDTAAAENGGDAATEANADGYQTYVDPETGEAYQYTATGDQDAAAAQQYEYVDPNTGETYVYDASAAEGDGAAEEGAGAAATSTYVDPTTGEAYQYEADPNASEGYQTYVDPETGETYQYQDPSVA